MTGGWRQRCRSPQRGKLSLEQQGMEVRWLPMGTSDSIREGMRGPLFLSEIDL